jgi:pimeloyl-ACP methyl ester carboxylesterase
VVFYIWCLYQTVSNLLVGKLHWAITWLLIDIIFISITHQRFHTHRITTDHLPPLTSACIDRIIQEIRNKSSIPDPRLFFSGWFHGIEFTEISKTDMKKLFAGMCYNKTPLQLSNLETETMDELIATLEFELDHEFTSGRENIAMLLTVDKMELIPRPTIYYAVTIGLSIPTHVTLWTLGFKYTHHPSVSTYYRHGTADALPIVLFHGIGIGLTPYLSFIRTMVKRYPNHTIVCFEMSSVAMRLQLNHLLPVEYAQIYKYELDLLGIDKILAIGHSLGTTSLCWLDRFYPSLIHSRIFIDPICFSLWTHDIAKNFVYRRPDKWVHYLLKFLISMEPGIALYLKRYFVWHQNTYYSMDLPKNTKIYLSGGDDIVHTDYVAQYLDRFPEKSRSYEIVPGAKHGQIIMMNRFDDVIAHISKASMFYCD